MPITVVGASRGRVTSMAKKGTGKRNSATESLRRADADVKRDKAIAKARAKVEKRRHQLGNAMTALAELEAVPSAARPPEVKTQAAAAKPATAKAGPSKPATAKAGPAKAASTKRAPAKPAASRQVGP